MKKILFLITVLFFIILQVHSLEVSKKELQSISNNSTIEFINYTGPHKKIDSIEAIKGIGSNLAQNIPQKLTEFQKNGNLNRYSVIHAVDSSQKDKLDADIILIGKDATVDHITNVRRIISAYLSAAYNYSQEDADTLAVFITVYNAVYRSDLDSFKSKYKDIVIQNLTQENCGLSVNYKDWPGNSQIVIPLFDVTSSDISTVDTSVISDTKVVTSMKEDDDKNVEARKNMVDIKEREAENAQDKAQNAQKTAVEEQKKVNEEKNKTQEVKKEAELAQKEAEYAQKEAEEKQNAADENPENQQLQKEAEEAQKKADDAQKEAEEKQQELENQEQKQAEQEEKAQAAKEEAKNQQALADKKQTEAQNERKDIAKDQKEIAQKQAEQAKMPVDYAIVITDENQYLSKLVRFNKETGEIIKSSPVNVIRNRTFFDSNENYIAICGEENANGTIKLVTIDKESMEITKESDYKIAAASVLVQENDEYYCVTDENGKFFVAKFANDLSLKQKSQIQVLSCTPITITQTALVVTNENGSLSILDKETLQELTGK